MRKYHGIATILAAALWCVGLPAAMAQQATGSAPPQVAAVAPAQPAAGQISLAQFIATLPQGPVTGEALRRLVAGSTMVSKDTWGRPFTHTYRENGSMGRSKEDTDPNEEGEKGKWWLEGDRLCFHGDWNENGVNPCRSFKRRGSALIESVHGHEVTFTR